MPGVALFLFVSSSALADSPLPPEGSVCESSLEIDREEVELPVYRVYTHDQLKQGFTVGTQYTFEHSPMDLPTPRPATGEIWIVLQTDDAGIQVQIEQHGDIPKPGDSITWQGSWEEWGERWTFDVSRVQVGSGSCKLGKEKLEGVRVTEQVQIGALSRELVYCFSADGAMPPIQVETFDDGKRSGSGELVSVRPGHSIEND